MSFTHPSGPQCSTPTLLLMPPHAGCLHLLVCPVDPNNDTDWCSPSPISACLPCLPSPCRFEGAWIGHPQLCLHLPSCCWQPPPFPWSHHDGWQAGHHQGPSHPITGCCVCCCGLHPLFSLPHPSFSPWCGTVCTRSWLACLTRPHTIVQLWSLLIRILFLAQLCWLWPHPLLPLPSQLLLQKLSKSCTLLPWNPQRKSWLRPHCVMPLPCCIPPFTTPLLIAWACSLRPRHPYSARLSIWSPIRRCLNHWSISTRWPSWKIPNTGHAFSGRQSAGCLISLQCMTLSFSQVMASPGRWFYLPSFNVALATLPSWRRIPFMWQRRLGASSLLSTLTWFSTANSLVLRPPLGLSVNAQGLRLCPLSCLLCCFPLPPSRP